MTTVASIDTDGIVTQYQRGARITIADGDTANLTKFSFAGFELPFTRISSTVIEFDAPGTVARNYEQIDYLNDTVVESTCAFNITHPIKVPQPGTIVDDNSILAGIGNSTKRYARLNLPAAARLDGITSVRSVEAIQNADNFVSAEFSTPIGAELGASVDVIDNTGAVESYPVTLIAGADDPGTAPILTIYGGSATEVSLGSAFTPSFSAVDVTEGDITSRVIVTGTVNTNVEGSTVISFSITNIFGKTTTATQTVTVKQNIRYEIQLLASLDQNVQSVTRIYPFGYVIAENGARDFVVIQNISLTNGETIISQSDVSFGSFAQMAKSGTTKVNVILIDVQNNAASLPTNIPLIAIPL